MKALREYLNSKKQGLAYWGVSDTLFNSAMKELEELEKPKTCESCKYAEPVLSDTKVWCKSKESPIGNIVGLALPKNYGCVHHEEKIGNDKIS